MTTNLASKRIMIAGGSGFLGRSLAAFLSARGAEVFVLSRRVGGAAGDWRTVQWDGRTIDSWIDVLDGADALINLAGRSVDCVKTPDHCDEILRSRVESTAVLGAAVREIAHPPPVWVQMSTAHIYGDPPEAVCDESSPTGFGLAPDVGRAWERAFESVLLESMRSVVLRTSFVVGKGGGAMAKLGMLARLGLGGTVGSGRQGMSWIHLRDMNRIFARALTNDSMRGVYVATAPNPVSNRVFMRALRRALRMPIGLPAPSAAVRIAAPLLLRSDPELALYGRYCVPKRLLEEGFEFEFSEIEPALMDLYR